MFRLKKQIKKKNGVKDNWFVLFCCLVLMGLGPMACIQPDTFPDEPHISSVTVNKNSIDNFVEDFTIVVQFEDGDGDLGISEEDTLNNVFVTDVRTGFVDVKTLPNIPPQGSVDDISGEIIIAIPNTCCILDSIAYCTPTSGFPDFDTVYYDVQIRDQADNFSNIVRTPGIVIRCN